MEELRNRSCGVYLGHAAEAAESAADLAAEAAAKERRQHELAAKAAAKELYSMMISSHGETPRNTTEWTTEANAVFIVSAPDSSTTVPQEDTQTQKGQIMKRVQLQLETRRKRHC